MVEIFILLSNPLIFLVFLFGFVGEISYICWLIRRLFTQKQTHQTTLQTWLFFTWLSLLLVILVLLAAVIPQNVLFDYFSWLYTPVFWLRFLGFPSFFLMLLTTWFWVVVVMFALKLILDRLSTKLRLVQVAQIEVPITSFVATIVGMLLSFGLILFLEPADNIPYEFHIFNAHLKDVCSEEKFTSECPRTKTDLRNFDPPHYDSLIAKSRVVYYFDEVGKGTLIVRAGNTFLVSDRRFEDRWDYFTRIDFSQSPKKYPPKFEGNWERGYLWKVF